jgi:hypothetical protein
MNSSMVSKIFFENSVEKTATTNRQLLQIQEKIMLFVFFVVMLLICRVSQKKRARELIYLYVNKFIYINVDVFVLLSLIYYY